MFNVVTCKIHWVGLSGVSLTLEFLREIRQKFGFEIPNPTRIMTITSDFE
jgi:hypothetical protein